MKKDEFLLGIISASNAILQLMTAIMLCDAHSPGIINSGVEALEDIIKELAQTVDESEYNDVTIRSHINNLHKLINII